MGVTAEWERHETEEGGLRVPRAAGGGRGVMGVLGWWVVGLGVEVSVWRCCLECGRYGRAGAGVLGWGWR